MITKIIQVGAVGADGEYKMGEIRLVIDKDGEDFVIYQL